MDGAPPPHSTILENSIKIKKKNLKPSLSMIKIMVRLLSVVLVALKRAHWICR